jgi:glycosyltransferase involved in cell wall biosynthesis
MWADETLFYPSRGDLRAELGIPEDAVLLLYAGSLGHAQGLEALVDACARVDDPRLVCLVAGSGVAEQALRERAEAVGARSVRFIGRVPAERMTALMATADVAYIGLSTHPLSAVTMPSKTQATLAAGKAVVVAAAGDVADVVAESGAGFLAEPGDVESIAAAIRRACGLGRGGLADIGALGRRYYEVTFSIERGVSAVEELLAQAAETRGKR